MTSYLRDQAANVPDAEQKSRARLVLFARCALFFFTAAWFSLHALHIGVGHTVSVRFSADDRPARTDLALFLRRSSYALQTCCEHSTALIDVLPDYKGTARKFEVRSSDPPVHGSFRSEMRLRPNHLFQAAWYRGRIFVPMDWQASATPVVLMQWHGTRDILLGEAGNVPPLALEITRDQWRVTKAWDSRWFSPAAASLEGHQLLGTSTLEPGTWSEWTFYVRWAPDQSGRVTVWKNGVLVLNTPGPVGHQDLIGPYLKAGIYIPGWKDHGLEPAVTSRTVYFAHITSAATASALP